MPRRHPENRIKYIMLIEVHRMEYSYSLYTVLSSDGVYGHPDGHGDRVVWRSDRDATPAGGVYGMVEDFNAKLREEKLLRKLEKQAADREDREALRRKKREEDRMLRSGGYIQGVLFE